MEPETWRAAQREIRARLRSARGPTGGPTVPASAPPLSISVIVVCWNSAKVLGRCLEHLFAQDYPDYEVIVVDDGSTDETVAVAERAASTHPQLSVVRSDRNRGCPHARNLGLGRAKGELVAFVDADGYAAPDWLSRIAEAFEADPTIGGVASTVFFAGNPQVINGAGGTVNHQGWAADLSMNRPYARAEMTEEALYPMGCGMALRRTAIERVGEFDDRMLNYYDDVDYGVRLWRAGFRVVVARDAWVDHEFGGGGGGDQTRKRLLCERHRMRVALKHGSAASLRSWAAHELGEFRRAPAARRVLKLRAAAWNFGHLPSLLASRRRLRGTEQAPERLIAPSWGDEFPAGVPPILRPRPQDAGSAIDVAAGSGEQQLLYGWYPAERGPERSYRWAAAQAAALVRVDAPTMILRLDYTPVPVDVGDVELSVRRLDSADPLAPVWSTRLAWRHEARVVENHPLALDTGDYEVLFDAGQGWLEPPQKVRSLGLALAALSFEDASVIPPGGLDMASPDADGQLVSGWFAAERSGDRDYRWAGGRAAVIVRLERAADSMRLSYRFPPVCRGGLSVTVRSVEHSRHVARASLQWREGEWQEGAVALRLDAGVYVVELEADATWSNPDQREPDLPPESRALGFALARLVFEDGA